MVGFTWIALDSLGTHMDTDSEPQRHRGAEELADMAIRAPLYSRLDLVGFTWINGVMGDPPPLGFGETSRRGRCVIRDPGGGSGRSAATPAPSEAQGRRNHSPFPW